MTCHDLQQNKLGSSSSRETLKLRLLVEGVGHIVSFKNSKQITRFGKGENARHGLITSKPKKKQMDAIIQSFVSQLTCWFQTNEIEMETAQHQLSLIASYLPLDDSLKWIPEICVCSRRVSKGNEGAEITIERIRRNNHD